MDEVVTRGHIVTTKYKRRVSTEMIRLSGSLAAGRSLDPRQSKWYGRFLLPIFGQRGELVDFLTLLLDRFQDIIDSLLQEVDLLFERND